MHPFFIFYFFLIQRPQEHTTLGDEQTKKKKAVLQDFLFRDVWVIGLYLWPHFSFRSVAVLQRCKPLVQSWRCEGVAMVTTGYREDVEWGAWCSVMLSNFHLDLNLKWSFNASLKQREKSRHRKRKQPLSQALLSEVLPSFSCSAKPKLKAGWNCLLLKVLVKVLRHRKRPSAALLPPLTRRGESVMFVLLPPKIMLLKSRAAVCTVGTANKLCLLCAPSARKAVGSQGISVIKKTNKQTNTNWHELWSTWASTGT